MITRSACATIVLVVAGILATLAGDVRADDRPAGPRMKIKNIRWDWGEVWQGEPVRHAFEIENIGSEVLRITNVKPGCQCSVADGNYARQLAPGEKTEILIQIDTYKLKKPKAYTKNATITSNDPSQPQTKVYMSGVVKQVLASDPGALSFTSMVGEEISGEFELKVPSEDVNIELVELRPGRHAKIVVTEVEKGQRWSVKLNAPPSDKPGVRNDRLRARVKINGKKTLTVTFGVSLRSLDRIAVTPKGMLTFKRDATTKILNGGSVDRNIRITSGDTGFEFKVVKVELLGLDPEVFKTSITEVKPGTDYKITLSLTRFIPERFLRGSIRIITDDGQSTAKEIKVFARFDTSLKPVAQGG